MQGIWRIRALTPIIALTLALAGCAAQSSPAPKGVSATATPAPAGPATATPWSAGPGAWQPATNCQSMPASYQTSYGAGVNPPEQGSATTVSFVRTDNCGATVKSLTLPRLTGVVYNTNVSQLSIFASPINTQVAFLTIQTNLIIGSPACSTPAGATAMLHGGIDATPASSYVCQLQLVTSDGGVTWRPLSLPVPGVLGEISPERNDSLELMGQVRAQGSRLYGVVTNVGLGSSAPVPPGRLVASDDGGVTWKLADTALAAQGLGIWDFAPTPSGSTVYVTVEPVNDPAQQPPTYGATLSVWSSPDGGVTWKRESDAPGATSGVLVSGMVAGMEANGQRSVYLMISQKNTISIVGSLNDGATWQGDGSLSYTTPGGGMMGHSTFVGTLPDGSVVVINPYGGAPIMAWTPGSPPRAVAAPTSLFPYWDPVFQRQGGAVYMWLEGEQGGPGLQIRYTQLLL